MRTTLRQMQALRAEERDGRCWSGRMGRDRCSGQTGCVAGVSAASGRFGLAIAMAEGGDAERRLAEEEEEKDDDDSSESSDGGERSSRPGFLFGNVSRRLLLRRSEMPDVQAESGYALDRPVNPSFRRCASSLLHESSQADDNQQPAKTADAHDYASMHELATDDAPSEPARDDAVSLYLSQQAGASAHPIPTDPDTGTNAALSSVPLSSPAAPYHARGVMKMQRTFVRDAGPPSLDTAKASFSPLAGTL